MMDGDYGSGAWLRLEDASTPRTIPPFECYLLVNSATRTKFRAIRPGMSDNDTPTGWDDVVNSEQKTTITVYTISGILVARFSGCSINEAAQQLSAELHEGVFILRADNECVKLLLGGK